MKQYIEVPSPSFRILSDEEVKQQEKYRNSTVFANIIEKYRKEIIEDIYLSKMRDIIINDSKISGCKNVSG